MPKPATPVKSEAELLEGLKLKDQTTRRNGLIADVAEAEKKWEIRIGVELQYTAAGISPKLSLVDTKGQPKEDVEKETTTA